VCGVCVWCGVSVWCVYVCVCVCGVSVVCVCTWCVMCNCVWCVYVCVCVCVASNIQHPLRMLRIMSCMACRAPPCFSKFAYKNNFFGKNITDRKMFVLSLSASFVRNISYCGKKRTRFCHK